MFVVNNAAWIVGDIARLYSTHLMHGTWFSFIARFIFLTSVSSCNRSGTATVRVVAWIVGDFVLCIRKSKSLRGRVANCSL